MMRTALIQLNVSDDPVANLAATLDLLAQAARGGAGFVLTPECTNILSSNRDHQRTVLHVVAQGYAAPPRGMAEQLRGDGRPVARGEAHGSQHAFEPVHGVVPVKRASM